MSQAWEIVQSTIFRQGMTVGELRRSDQRKKTLSIVIPPSLWKKDHFSDPYIQVSAPRMLALSRIIQFLDKRELWITQSLEDTTQSQRYVERYLKSALPLLRSSLRDHESSLKERFYSLADQYQFALPFGEKNLQIRQLRSSWGLCRQDGKITLNRSLILLPQHLQDYVILHELTHLKHFNHSLVFWQALHNILPKTESYRLEIRVYKSLCSFNLQQVSCDS